MMQRAFAFAAPAEQRFEEFHGRHPQVYDKLVALAREAKRRGHRQWAARSAWELIRWEFAVPRDDGEQFKLNDHYIAYYARRIMADEPDLAGFFETRKLKSENGRN